MKNKTFFYFTVLECSDVMCAMYCPNGFLKGKNGCPVCKCNRE